MKAGEIHAPARGVPMEEKEVATGSGEAEDDSAEAR